MPQPQTGFADAPGVEGKVSSSGAELDRPVGFRFIVTWSSLSDQPRMTTQALPVIPATERARTFPAAARRLIPAAPPAPSAVAPALTAARANADQVAPVSGEKAGRSSGFQWEMVVPKMVRAPKKFGTPRASRSISPLGRAATADAAAAEQSAPNLYTASPSFLRSFSFKLCAGVLTAAVVIVPVWRSTTRPSVPEIQTSVEGGDWLRVAAIAGDPGVKQARQLVLYRPATKATDCSFGFDWRVDSGNVGMVFRAKDLGNYYAVRLKVLKPGSTPILAAEYFNVYQFVESPHSEKVLVFAKNDPVLRVRMDIAGPTFTLYLQGEATEYWTDARLNSGAPGFLEEWNRGPVIRAVRLSFPPRSQVVPFVPRARQFLAMGSRFSAGGGA